jgi:penicillin amidase
MLRALAIGGAVLCVGLALLFGQRSQPSLEELARGALSQIDGTLRVPGLSADVEIIRDTWGVPHIFAKSTEDLFFAQGYVMAQDRLWQMEIWRRSVEGRLAEILGAAALPRDRQSRLLRYRGAVDDREVTSYHPESRRIMTAYVAGVNAFMAQAEAADKLPVEFVLTRTRPARWTIETLLSRQVTFGDGTSELQLARAVAELGADEANRRRNPDPFEPLVVPPGVDVSAITDAVQAATRAGAPAPRPQIDPPSASLRRGRGAGLRAEADPGSNNWVVSGALSTTGKPVVANDPHREVTNPSLRYIVHLNAPGWNVAGATEPPFLGVAIGHNDRIAWGLTIVGTDQHDIYVEELNPSNHAQVKWNGGWEAIRVVREEIPVKDAKPDQFEMKFTRHGPVFYVDAERHRAYVLRSALHEPGTAPYLAGLRLSQARDCREFLDAAVYWKAPSENLICGDVDGNISWRASALTPRRKGWSGRLPVPGSGQFEWQGFRTDLPQELNPARGFIVTANHNIQPKGYAPPFMFKNAETRFERITRLLSLIQSGKKYSIDDHKRMQHDAYSLRAADELSSFRGWTSKDPTIERARSMLASWDATYRRDSAAAAIYEASRSSAGRGRGAGSSSPGTSPGRAPEELEKRLQQAVDRLTRDQGSDWGSWRWGRMHLRPFPHPFVQAFDIPAVERGGGAGTVAADGASYREIFDVSDWDRSLVINTPGQSGQPGSPFYSNLVRDWADDKYFQLVFSRSAVEKAAARTLILRP